MYDQLSAEPRPAHQFRVLVPILPLAEVAEATETVARNANLMRSRDTRLDTNTMSWDNFGEEGAELGSFVGPTGLATAPDGSALYVADEFNNRIQQFSFLEDAPRSRR